MKSIIHLLALAGLSFAQCPDLKWERDTLDLGTMDPGGLYPFHIGMQNTSKSPLSFSEVFAQGRGPESIQFDSNLAPGALGKLSFKYNSNQTLGSILENISLQGPNICLYSLVIKGEVRPALMFSPAQLNLGSLKEGSPLPEFDVLAWDPRAKGQVQLSPKALEWFEISSKATFVQTNQNEVIEAKSGLPAVKLHLKLKQIPSTPAGRKSIRLSLPLTNSLFPSAESYIFAAGWKGEINPVK